MCTYVCTYYEPMIKPFSVLKSLRVQLILVLAAMIAVSSYTLADLCCPHL